ncbi:MAG: App1 family protein, partial [Rubrobacteraceae bacterium]
RFDLENPPSDEMEWHPVRLSLVSPVPSGQSGARATGRVLVPESDRAEFGVISDIDDTVVLSKAASVLKMFWIVLLNNAHTRLPFPGVGAFYEALHRGGDGSRRNPLFYVSSSPWNIYDLLVDFMDVHGVPAGPIFLKDWSPTVLGKHEDHKLGLIRRLLADYPDLPFVLIGDSGQEDPEIYHDAAIENPGRIQAIYIRDVTGEERRKEITALSKRIPDVQMKLVKDSAAAAEHALSLDLVSRESAREVFAASE